MSSKLRRESCQKRQVEWDDLTNGMNGINAMIEKGDLYTDQSSSKPVVKKGNRMSVMVATVEYIYHWYGFDAIENAEMAALQGIVFQQAVYDVGLLAIPLGMAWTPSLLATGVSVWIFGTWANTCAIGALGNGVIVFCFGDPSSPGQTHSKLYCPLRYCSFYDPPQV